MNKYVFYMEYVESEFQIVCFFGEIDEKYGTKIKTNNKIYLVKW